MQAKQAAHCCLPCCVSTLSICPTTSYCQLFTDVVCWDDHTRIWPTQIRHWMQQVISVGCN
eukprot:scaffold215660_cov18-Prasinocladus_malaysianus.AAC.1